MIEYRITILRHLSSLFRDERLNIVRKSLEVLFQILKNNQKTFKEDFFQDLHLQVFDFLFQSVGLSFYKQSKNDDELYTLRKTIQNAYELYSEFLRENLEVLKQGLLRGYLNIYQLPQILLNDNFFKIVVDSFTRLVIEIGSALEREHWEIVLQIVDTIKTSTFPHEIFQNIEANENFQTPVYELIQNPVLRPLKQELLKNSNLVLSQCVIQTLIIEKINQIIEKFHPLIEEDLLDGQRKWLEEVYQSYRKFNNLTYYRYVLWKAGGLMSEMPHLPGLIKHERDAFAGIYKISYYLYLKRKEDSVLLQLIRVTKEYLNEYIGIQSFFDKQ